MHKPNILGIKLKSTISFNLFCQQPKAGEFEINFVILGEKNFELTEYLMK